MRRFFSVFVVLAVVAAPPVYADPATEAIQTPPSGTWPSFGRDYSNQRFSPLTQIDAGNVHRLARAWTYRSGIQATFQATPIVVDRTMYLSLPFNHVVALDARTGEERWRYVHTLMPGRTPCCGPSNRGVAVADGKVFMGTVDGRLIALDQRSGARLWDVDLLERTPTQTESVSRIAPDDPLAAARFVGSTGAGIAMAPVVYQGKVLIGITGVGFGLHLDSSAENPLTVVGLPGNYGRSGFLAAFDAATGARLWTFDTVRAGAWEGDYRSHTPDGHALPRDIPGEKAAAARYPSAWKFGGGAAWSSPAIDTLRGLLYFGTGNPSPNMEDSSRPGDNLYTTSLVALEIETGALRWHFQQVPHDIWGYDVASPAVLFDFERDGRRIPAVAQASKLGWLYIHDRETGALLLKSDAFVPQHNLFQRPTTAGLRVHPGVTGGVNWSPMALDATAGLAYVAAMHWPVIYTLHEKPAANGRPASRYTSMDPVKDERWGVLAAIDLKTGHVRWQHRTREPLIGGTLATAGNLVFVGEGTGELDAFDATRGTLLWQHTHDAGVNAPPITYAIDGVQYVAVVVGGNHLFGFTQGDQVAVYALGR
ncbi:PQQ-binding-like beta-propeller repeat protein [Zoogloea sp.]|uniref:pyrroloquinoline quinone-dependent dehydrogenase n=1 Tax=Zoogloea sp. TaxID=49181 RepID=UPI002BB13A18|nr:PQQ-binding-like beta-propeller repeat protein [Zoogloea sp.]HNH16652.1 PQQ-binding-like beta-propeller repeat protein [Zoogloea sp.]